MKKVFLSSKVTVVDQRELKRARVLIEKVVGVSDLTSPCRKEPYTAARALMASYCKSIGMSRDQIAPFVGRKEGAIYNMLFSHKCWLRSWPLYKDWFNQFNNRMK